MHVDASGVGDHDSADAALGVETHEAVEAAAAAFLEIEALPPGRADMPAERHGDGAAVARPLLLGEEPARRVAAHARLIAELILEEARDTVGAAAEPAERGAVQVVLVDVQPRPAITPDKL